MSLAGLPGPSAEELGRRFNLVSLLPSTALVLFVLLLLRSGAATGRPQLDRLAPDQLVGQGRTLADLVYLSAAIIVISLVLYPFQTSLVRAFEGYWVGFPMARTATAIGRELQRRRREMLELRSSILISGDVPDGGARPTDAAVNDQLRTLKTALEQSYPENDDQLLPTRLGNVLRAAEDRAGEHYGLDAVDVWPWLYPHVTGRHAQALDETRSQLDAYIRLSLALLAATLIAAVMLINDGPWLAIPAATALLAWLSYQAAVRTAVKYGQGIFIAFDFYRFDMLRGMHLPLPDSLEQEVKLNKELMTFLDDRRPIFGSRAKHLYQHQEDVTGPLTTSGSMATSGGLWSAIVGAWRRRRRQARSP